MALNEKFTKVITVNHGGPTDRHSNISTPKAASMAQHVNLSFTRAFEFGTFYTFPWGSASSPPFTSTIITDNVIVINNNISYIINTSNYFGQN